MSSSIELPLAEVNAALQSDRPDEAERILRLYLIVKPNDEDALTLLAISLQHQGKPERAVEIYSFLTRQFPDSAIHWNNLAVSLHECGRDDDALAVYLQALKVAPADYNVLLNLGFLYMRKRAYHEARQYFLRARDADPDASEPRIHAAQMSIALDDRDVAEELIKPWRDWDRQDEPLQLSIGLVLMQLGQLNEGERIFRELLRRNPDNLRARGQLVLVCERNNQLDEARRLLAMLPTDLSGLDDETADYIEYAQAVVSARGSDAQATRALLERMLSKRKADWMPYHDLYFMLAKACDKLGDADATMSALANAHAAQLEIARQSVPELLEPDSQPIGIATYRVEPQQRARWPALNSPTIMDSPIFIVGFPRSGTTMMEQMLDAHPSLESMDERTFLQDLIERISSFGLEYPDDLEKLTGAQCDELRDLYWSLTAEVAPRAEGQRLVDKNPLNILRLPLINRLFPESPIILALRHPCDVILSCYMQNFNKPAFTVLCATLDRLARGYAATMQFCLHHIDVLQPRVLELRYEDLVADLPGQSQRLGDFLALEDSTSLLHFHEHARGKDHIGTPSYSQVIEPVNNKAVNRWHRYRRHMEPILPAVKPILDHWNYEA